MNIYTALKSPKTAAFGMLTMVIGLFQMYAKLYYAINPHKLMGLLDIMISITVASGFSVATLIILVQAKKVRIPALFALLDAVAGLLYFNVVSELYAGSPLVSVLPGMFISLLSAVVLFSLGEVFVSRSKAVAIERREADAIREQLEQEMANMRDSYQTELTGLDIALKGAREQNHKLEEMLAKRQLLLAETSDTNRQAQMQIERLSMELDALKQQSTAWREVYETEMARREKIRSKTQQA